MNTVVEKRKCFWISCRSHNVTTQRTLTIICLEVRLSHPGRWWQFWFCEWRGISCSDHRPKLTRISLTSEQFHTFLCHIRLVSIYVLGFGGSMLRISDCRPTNTSRVPGVPYQNIQLNSRIVCSNQIITSSLFICSGSLHIKLPFFFYVRQRHHHHHHHQHPGGPWIPHFTDRTRMHIISRIPLN